MNVPDPPKAPVGDPDPEPQGRRQAGLPDGYTSSVARLLDHEVDLLLVGDSLAMTVYGFDSTLPIGARHDDRARRRRGALDRARAGHRSICRSAAIRNRPQQAFRAAARVWPRPAAPRSSSKAARRWPRRLRFLDRARRAGDGPCRADAASGQRARRLSLARARAGPSATRSCATVSRSPRPARSRWSSRALPRAWRAS